MSGGYGELGPILLTGKLLWNPIVSNTIPGSFQLIQKCILRQISYACAMKNVYCRVLLPKGNDQISSIAIVESADGCWRNPEIQQEIQQVHPCSEIMLNGHSTWCPLLQKSGKKKRGQGPFCNFSTATWHRPESMMFAIVSKKGSKYPVDPRSMCGWFIATTFFAKIGV